MKQVEYATDQENQTFLDQLKELKEHDQRLSSRTVALMMGRSSTYFSTISKGQRNISADDYRMWKQRIWPELSKRIAEYRQLNDEALSNFVTDRIGPNLKKVAAAMEAPEDTILHRIWYTNRRSYLLSVYDAIKGYQPYRELRFRHQTPMQQLHALRYQQVPTEVLAITDQLSSALVPLKVISRILLGNEQILPSLHRKRTMSFHPETLKLLSDNLAQLRQLNRWVSSMAPQLPNAVDIEDILPLAGGRTLKELAEVLKTRFDLDYLHNKDGSFKLTLSRGRVLTIIGLLQLG